MQNSSCMKEDKRNNELPLQIAKINSKNEITIVSYTSPDINSSLNQNNLGKNLKENSKAQDNSSDDIQAKQITENISIIPDPQPILNHLKSRIDFLKRIFAPVCLTISGIISITYLTILIIFLILSCALVYDCIIYLSVGFAASFIISINSLRILICLMSSKKEEFSKCFFYGVIPLFFALLADIVYSLATIKNSNTQISLITDVECASNLKKIKLIISINHLVISVIYLLYPIFTTTLIYRYNYNLQKYIQVSHNYSEISL